MGQVKSEKQTGKKENKTEKKKGNVCMDSNLADCRFFRVILGFTCHGLAR